MSTNEYLDPQDTQGPQNRAQRSVSVEAIDPKAGMTLDEMAKKNRRMVALDVFARQIELAHYPQIREWRGNGRPTCARCGSSWPCQRARDAVRLREILGGGDDPGDDGARDLIPEVTATRAVPKARKPGTAHEAKEAA
ncbi:hypothetical protein [Propionibacterium freudenreichii]|uniref:hypothetical protein n=1 Tax=Propionibacterium freudenreichii TaxID=1744 RepID=UPI000541F5D7|nr:hypothetical protein [Propionibacterium freudenreichii]CEG97740.1 Protein of unknown function [Propionibacterium freudenreichii]